MDSRLALLIVLAALLGSSPPPAAAQSFDLPVGGGNIPAEDPADPPVEDAPPTFYDEEIPDTSDSVIYVVDRSSSMLLPVSPFIGEDGEVVTDGSRLDLVKAEIRRSIASLPDTFTFNIIIYCECIEAWRAARVPATPANKTAALGWVAAIEPWGWTNTGGAASTALDDRGNEVVLLLSDGAPNFLDCAQSWIGDYDQHRRKIRDNNTQGAVIHTFGIGLDPDTRQFMIDVAHDAGGTFREID